MQEFSGQAAFIHFLRTGELGPLSCGQNLGQVHALLGEPDSVGKPCSGTDHGNLVNLFYGDLTVTFLDDELMAILVQPRECGDLPLALAADWYDTVRTFDCAGFICFLKGQGIPCQRVLAIGEWTDVGTTFVLSQAGIEITFDSEADYRLYKMVSSPAIPVGWQLEDCWYH